jgi:hypothetical protein
MLQKVKFTSFSSLMQATSVYFGAVFGGNEILVVLYITQEE